MKKWIIAACLAASLDAASTNFALKRGGEEIGIPGRWVISAEHPSSTYFYKAGVTAVVVSSKKKSLIIIYTVASTLGALHNWIVFKDK